MPNKEHIAILRQGIKAWCEWRNQNPNLKPDLSCANLIEEDLTEAGLCEVDLREAKLMKVDLTKAELTNANLCGADLTDAILMDAEMSGAKLVKAELCGAKFHKANLTEAELGDAYLHKAELTGAYLTRANLTRANLAGADISGADLREANLIGADLTGADLREANLSRTNLRGANLTGADLRGATLVETNLENANLNGCRVYGISVWNLKVNQETKQSNLLITHPSEAEVTVDDLEVANFIYLLLNRKKLRNVLDTITSKAVLVLGRFTAERKAVLDALADELRKYNLLPIIFDFERSKNRDFTETIKILAGLSLFVIVDITKPKSAPQELTAIVPDYQIPFVPILEEGEDPYSMFGDFKRFDWVLKPLLKYSTKEVLLANFRNIILEPALRKHKELQHKKNEEFEAISIEDMIAQKEQSVF